MSHRAAHARARPAGAISGSSTRCTLPVVHPTAVKLKTLFPPKKRGVASEEAPRATDIATATSRSDDDELVQPPQFEDRAFCSVRFADLSA